MTIDEYIALADTLPMDDHRLAPFRLQATYHKRLMSYRKAQAEAEREVQQGCVHVWEEWKTGHKLTYHHKRCVVCKKQVDWDSGD